MPNATSTFPGTFDSLNAAYDPDIGPAVQRMQEFWGGYNGPASLTGVNMQTFPDEFATGTIQPASGTVELALVQFRAGHTVNTISLVTAATAGVSITRQWAGIASYVAGSAGVCLATSADGTSGALAADTVITFTLTAPYVIPTSGAYYVYYCIAGSTVPTIAAGVTLGAHGRGNVAPFLYGPGDTGKTTPYAVAAAVAAPTATAVGTLLYLT